MAPQRQPGVALDQIPPERRLDRLERGIGLGAVRAAGLRHVGPAAAALAAERLGALAHQIDGVEARGEIGGDADHDAGLAVVGDADDRDDAGADLLLALVGEAARGPSGRCRTTARARSLMSPTLRTPSSPPPACAPPPMASFFLRVGQLALELPALVEQRGDPRRHVLKRHFKLRRRRFSQLN